MEKFKMPRIKTKRDDILRPSEISDMIEASKFEPWVQCLICILAVFGKRISEVIRLKRSDVWFDDEYLYARFSVLKKASRKATSIPITYLKRKTRNHPFIKPIVQYIIQVEKGYLFPSKRSSYGYISRQHAYNKIKALNPKAWCHLFRESLATSMAEHGATEEELLHWFDWDRVDTAHQYVKRGTKLTEKWSDRAY